MPFKKLQLMKDSKTDATYSVCIEYQDSETNEHTVVEITYERLLNGTTEKVPDKTFGPYMLARLNILQIEFEPSKEKRDDFIVKSKSEGWSLVTDIKWLDERNAIFSIHVSDGKNQTIYKEDRSNYETRSQIRFLRNSVFSLVYEKLKKLQHNNNNNNISHLAPQTASPIHTAVEQFNLYNLKNWKICSVFYTVPDNNFYCIYKHENSKQFILMPILEPWKYVQLSQADANNLGNYMEHFGFCIKPDVRNSSLENYFSNVQNIRLPSDYKEILIQHFIKITIAYWDKIKGTLDSRLSKGNFINKANLVEKLGILSGEKFHSIAAYPDNAIPTILDAAKKILQPIAQESSEQSALLETSSDTSSCCTLV